MLVEKIVHLTVEFDGSMVFIPLNTVIENKLGSYTESAFWHNHEPTDYDTSLLEMTGELPPHDLNLALPTSPATPILCYNLHLKLQLQVKL